MYIRVYVFIKLINFLESLPLATLLLHQTGFCSIKALHRKYTHFFNEETDESTAILLLHVKKTKQIYVHKT